MRRPVLALLLALAAPTLAAQGPQNARADSLRGSLTAERLEILYCLEGLGELTDGETGDHHAVVAGTIWIAPPGSRAELMAFRGMRVMRVVAPAVR